MADCLHIRCEPYGECLLEEPELDPCPTGCGWPTEDPYGGPCKRCWDKVPRHG